jgi:hypothetical protein
VLFASLSTFFYLCRYCPARFQIPRIILNAPKPKQLTSSIGDLEGSEADLSKAKGSGDLSESELHQELPTTIPDGAEGPSSFTSLADRQITKVLIGEATPIEDEKDQDEDRTLLQGTWNRK